MVVAIGVLAHDNQANGCHVQRVGARLALEGGTVRGAREGVKLSKEERREEGSLHMLRMGFSTLTDRLCD